jgi:hypothetical protein
MVEPGLAILRLVPAVSTYLGQKRRQSVTIEEHFLDLVVDGRPLRSVTAEGYPVISPLSRFWNTGEAEKRVEILLGRRPNPDLDPPRVELLVCLLCGDIGCGSVTARLDLTATTVGWSDFQWEDSVAYPVDHGPIRVDGLDQAFVFDRRQYEAELAGAVERIAALPFDEAGHRNTDPKRRWWWRY